MKTQIMTLIEALRGSHDLLTITEQFAACCAWVKLSETSKLDPEQQLQTSGANESLQNVMNDCVSVQFTSRDWSLSDEELHHLFTSLQHLVRANVISFTDLSIAIKAMLENGGKKHGELAIPNELSQLGISLLGDQTDSVYCPFTAGHEFAHQLPSASNVEGETPMGSDAFYAEVHNILLDKQFNVVCTDPILLPTFIGDGGLKQFQSAIAMPPFGLKYKKTVVKDIWERFPEDSLTADVYQLRHMLAHATNCVVGFVTNGFLFRSAAGEKLFKQDMVRKNWLKAVIALPSNLLSITSIPVSIIVLDKNKTDDSVLFIDANNEFFIKKASRVQNKLVNTEQILSLFKTPKASNYSNICSSAEIEAMDYNLSPSRYIMTHDEVNLQNFLKEHDTVKLADLVDIVRPQAVKHDETAKVKFIEHNLTSLNSIGQFEGIGKTVLVAEKDIAKAEKQKIKPNDVLVSCRGAVGRVALIDHEIDDNVIASQAFAILRLKPSVDNFSSVALYQYLISDYGQLILSGLVTGTAAQMLSANDLNKISIPIFSVKIQAKLAKVREQVLKTNKQILELQQHIDQINSDWLTQTA